MNTQKLFTEALRTALEARNQILVIDQNWANTGTYRAIPTGSLSQVLEVHYSFQDGYATFEVKNAVGSPLKTFHYVENHELAETLVQILTFLPAQLNTSAKKRAAVRAAKAARKA